MAREAHGLGTGDALLAAIESQARARDCKRLMLNNRIAAESFARGFYAKRGYRHREDFANFVKVLE